MKTFSTLSLILLAFSVFSVTGCGKYGPPLAPETVAPEQVADLIVTPLSNAVEFNWRAPQRDQRGKELKDIEGYRVYRRTIVKQTDIVDRHVEFDLLATIRDTHIIERERIRSSLREQGKPARRADVSSEKKKFRHVDSAVKTGISYLYQIVPINNGGVEGRASDQYLIAFQGADSKITKLESEEEVLPDAELDL